MELIEIIGGVLTPLTAFVVGFNIGRFNYTITKLSKDPFKSEEYENFLKNKREDSFKNFFNYYVGMPGRYFAYKYFDNPKNWK